MDKPYVLVVEAEAEILCALVSLDHKAKPWELKVVADTEVAKQFMRQHEVAVVVVYCDENPEAWQPFLTWLKNHDVMVIRLSVVTPRATQVNQSGLSRLFRTQNHADFECCAS